MQLGEQNVDPDLEMRMYLLNVICGFVISYIVSYPNIVIHKNHKFFFHLLG